MYINAVLSYLGAWEKLQTQYQWEFEDLQRVIEWIDVFAKKMDRKHSSSDMAQFSPKELDQFMRQGFREAHWEIDSKLFLGQSGKRRYSGIDAIRNGIGVEFQFGKFAFVESDLFVKFPLFVRARRIQVGCILMPMELHTRYMTARISNFEMIRDRLMDLYPLPLKYPFVILGLSDQNLPVQVNEMTSEIDRYLIDVVGYTLLEMKLLTERPNYDFKKEPPDNKKLAKNACAFANTKGGGLFLFGVDDNGNIVGLSRDKLDETQQWCGQIIHTTCSPKPEFEFKVFDVAGDPTKCVLVLRIIEILHKPCMAFEKVYVRSGSPDGQAAKPEEIRRLVLRSD